MKLKDKVFIVTGATNGMGRGIALKFIEEGASLFWGLPFVGTVGG